MKKLLLIEDDPFMVEWIQRLVAKEYGSNLIVEVISSEREFLLRLPGLSDIKVIIVDLMLPWEDGVLSGSTEFQEPRGDHLVAGTRIIQDLIGDERLQKVPILFYTVNDEPIPLDCATQFHNLTYLRKDEPDERLMAWLRKAIVSKVH